MWDLPQGRDWLTSGQFWRRKLVFCFSEVDKVQKLHLWKENCMPTSTFHAGIGYWFCTYCVTRKASFGEAYMLKIVWRRGGKACAPPRKHIKWAMAQYWKTVYISSWCFPLLSWKKRTHSLAWRMLGRTCEVWCG